MLIFGTISMCMLQSLYLQRQINLNAVSESNGEVPKAQPQVSMTVIHKVLYNPRL
jgi:hypothetical protein